MNRLQTLFGGALPQLVMFDMDGTLVDSVPDMAAAVDAMLAQLGRPPVGNAQVRNWVGNGSDVLVRRALAGGLDYSAVDDQQAAEALQIMLPIYGRSQALTEVYPGVRETLAWLREQGITMVVVTNKPGQFVEPLLRKKGLAEFFSGWLGGDSLPQKKPQPEPLLYSLKQAGVSAGQALFVGDSVNDVLASRAAGVRCVAVSYGYNHGRPVAEEGADLVVDDLRELWQQ